jgi:hypothetical protein
MYDYLLSFKDEATARKDAAVGKYWTSDGQGGGSWQLHQVNPTIFFWDERDDTMVDDGQGGQRVVHKPYDTQWRALISLVDRDPALDASKGMEIIADRDSFAIIQTSFQAQALEYLKMQPVFTGMEGYVFMQP